jgi:hypothetical protein
MDPYKTLRVQPGASESDVRKAFRKLALQVWFYLMFLSLIRLMNLDLPFWFWLIFYFF